MAIVPNALAVPSRHYRDGDVCRDCGKPISNRSKRCLPCANTRRYAQPTDPPLPPADRITAEQLALLQRNPVLGRCPRCSGRLFVEQATTAIAEVSCTDCGYMVFPSAEIAYREVQRYRSFLAARTLQTGNKQLTEGERS